MALKPTDVDGVEGRRRRLLEELERLRERLAADPNVLRAWVFGSVASGAVHAWSDLDVVVVVRRADAPFLERAARLTRALRPRVGLHLLVYAVEELRALKDRPFVRHEIFGKGREWPLRPREDARRRLAFAREDLKMAELALDAGLFNQACFHAQQCAEKALKAALARAGALIPRTHALADLWEELPQALQEALQPQRDAILELDSFYIPTRYPDALPGTLPEGLPRREHAERALRTARACLEAVEAWVSA